ncbi:sensor histidine kinase [Agilicoccus flavus]|uniref:sensor histidine kinase n=1 Tax=Agilicoccus flavus TaxID=2775968 RepID=UPI001CF65043|nr:histidine kinase [Agilicoccus flavus]
MAAVLVLALFVVAQLVAALGSSPTPAELALDVGVSVVLLALLALLVLLPVRPVRPVRPFRPGVPLAAALAAGALAALSPVATPVASAAMLWVARADDRRSVGAAAAVGIGGHLVLAAWRPYPGLTWAWWALLVVAAYAMLVGWGRWARARQDVLAALCERAERAETEQAAKVDLARRAERARIAREMHDVLAHRLSLIATHAGAVEYRPDASPERIVRAAGVVREGVHQALDELRDVIGLLRDPPEAPETGSPGGRPAGGAADVGADPTGLAAPQPTLRGVPALVDETRAAGTAVRPRVACDAAAVPATTGRTAFRVVQEALTNARRHAPGAHVEVSIDGRVGAGLDIVVANARPPGPAVAPGADRALAAEPAAARGSGSGLLGLAERVALLGGTMTTDARSDRFVLEVWLPWPT